MILRKTSVKSDFASFIIRNRIRMYPAYCELHTINTTSFSLTGSVNGHVDALLEVADKYLSEESLGSEEEVRVRL